MTPGSFDTYQTSFVGRDKELADLRNALSRGERLVTLLGPPGTGKTRLAMRYADSAEGYDSIIFVDLSEARSASDVVARVGRALGGDGLPHALAAAGRSLVVLDNFEHLVTAAPSTIGVWLPSATNAHFLVTSRERLRISGERVLELEPLAVPDAGETSLDALRTCDAVALFADRADGFELADDDYKTIATIVRRLDGIPLAIELAATRLAVLGPEALLERLSSRFEVLSTGPRGVAERQATLANAIEWSWTLLDTHEQATMAQCSVFRGGFPLAAAEAVVALADDSPPLLDLLQSLTEKSLLRTYRLEGPKEIRFVFYQSIREYSVERLDESARRKGVVLRHANYYQSVGRDLERARPSPRGPGFLKRFELELDNLAAAYENVADTPVAFREGIGRALAATMAIERVMTGRPKLGTFQAMRDAAYDSARCAGLNADQTEPEQASDDIVHASVLRFLGAVYAALGRHDDGKTYFERALARLPDDDDANRARILYSFGTLRSNPADANEGIRVLEEALELARAVGDQPLESRIRTQLGNLHLFAGRCDRAVSHYRAAIDGCQGQEDEALILGNLAVADQERGNFSEALVSFEAALERHRESKNERLEAGVVGYLGTLAHEQGNHSRAAELYDEALALLAKVGSRRVEALFLCASAALLAGQGDLEAARNRFEAAERRCREVDDVALWTGLSLHRAHLDLVEAKALEAAGDRKAAAAIRREVRELALAVRSGASPWQGRGRPLADQWDDLRFALRLLEAELSDNVFVLAADGSYFVPPGEDEVSLARRHVLRRLLTALVTQRGEHRGRPLSLDDLIEHGWPGERMDPAAATNRVHVSLTTLRKLGLRTALQRVEDGYLIDPDLVVEIRD